MTDGCSGIVPVPKAVAMKEGVLRVGGRVVASEGELRPLAVVLVDEIRRLTGKGMSVADGYPVINTSWQPIYVVGERAWPPEDIYGWNMYRWENWWEHAAAHGDGIDVEPTPQVLGAQMCAWQQSDEEEVPSLRQRLPAMSEQIWNPEAARDFKDFLRRLSVTDASLTKLLGG